MKIELLSVQGVLRDGTPTSAFRWQFRARGADGQPSGPFEDVGFTGHIQMPSSPRPFFFDVRVVPDSKRFWPVEDTFAYVGDGILHRQSGGAPWVDDVLGATEFLTPQALDFDVFGSQLILTQLPVCLSRVRDVTAEILKTLLNEPALHYGKDPTFGEFLETLGPRHDWIKEWKPPPRKLHLLSLTAQSGTLTPAVQVDERDVGLESRVDRIVEIAGVEAPRLVALSWPRSLDPRQRDPLVAPFFIFFRSYFLTNPTYYGRSPDRRWAFLTNSLWQWSNFQFDPVSGKSLGSGPAPRVVDAALHRQGIPYQAQASGREMVTLLPMGTMGHKPNEYGSFLQAAELREILLEIQAHGWRQWGMPFGYPAGIGRVAMSAFSMANDLLGNFVASAGNADFAMKELRELYLMDPPTRTGVQQKALKQIAAWMKSAAQPASDPPRARLYSRSPEGAKTITSLVGNGNGIADEQVFVSVLNATQIVALHKSHGGKGPGGNDPTHAMYPGLFVTDALTRSGFAKN